MMDRQSEAFRHSTPEDWSTAADRSGCVRFTPDDGIPIRSPEEWEAVEWDRGREAPKTVEEARAALEARIADPHAPDGDEVAGAYDDLEA